MTKPRAVVYRQIMEHSPDDTIHGSISRILEGRTIIIGLTGSVAVMRSLEIARELIRHGAAVLPVMSRAACEFIGPKLVHWATGNTPVVELSGANEHVALAGNSSSRADLLLIAPCTANTIGKIASGIDDTVPTTFATTALGQGIPILLAPAMHEPMYHNPAVLRNMEITREFGIGIIEAPVIEGKAKMADTQYVVDACIRGITGRQSPLAGRSVLITAGRTVEYLDPIRVITNNSSGKMGVALARAAYHAGADVTLVYGKGTVEPPQGVRVVRVESAEEMMNEVLVRTKPDHNETDILIAAAAVGDWKARNPDTRKTPTNGMTSLQIDLVPTPKIIDAVRTQNTKVRIIAFRAQHRLSRYDLTADARARMLRAGADMIAVNDVSVQGAGFETDTNQMIILLPDGTEIEIPLASKISVATRVMEAAATYLL